MGIKHEMQNSQSTEPDTATKRKRTLFSVFSLTGLKGRIPNSKYLHINQDIKENIMSTFVTAVFAVIFTLIAIGQFIWAILVSYRGLT